jgi:hypothetical protein
MRERAYRTARSGAVLRLRSVRTKLPSRRAAWVGGGVGVVDAKHAGDKAALFADLDADGDLSISAEEMAKMESHVEDMAKAQPKGLWGVRLAISPAVPAPAVAPSFLPVRAAVHLTESHCFCRRADHAQHSEAVRTAADLPTCAACRLYPASYASCVPRCLARMLML